MSLSASYIFFVFGRLNNYEHYTIPWLTHCGGLKVVCIVFEYYSLVVAKQNRKLLID